jgi:hypothetical protein
MSKQPLVITGSALLIVGAVLFLFHTYRIQNAADHVRRNTPPPRDAAVTQSAPPTPGQEDRAVQPWMLLDQIPELSIGATNYIIQNQKIYFVPIESFPNGSMPAGFDLQKNILDGADLSTYEVYIPALRNQALSYAKDKNHVYCGGDVLAGADAASFSVIFDIADRRYPTYAKDAHHVYNQCFDVRGPDTTPYYPQDKVDPASFGLIDSGVNYHADGGYWEYIWFKDKDNLYIYDPEEVGGGLRIVSNIDRETFQVVPNLYGQIGKDKNHVYVVHTPEDPRDGKAQVSILPGADPATIAPVATTTDSAFAKDKDHVYVGGTIVPGADPATIRITGVGNDGEQSAQDKNNVYRERFFEGTIQVLPDGTNQ